MKQKNDFRNYKEHLQKLKKSDTYKYRHIKPAESKKKLRDNIGSSIGKKEDHSDSIFPKEFDYGCDSHKMYIDKKSHHIVFYKIVTPKPEFYLRKFLVCPHCGRAITGATSTGGRGGIYYYYFCPTTGKHLRMSADEVNRKFVNYISSLRPNNAIMHLYLEILNDLRKDGVREIEFEISKLRTEMREIGDKMDKIEDKFIDGEIDKDMYNRMIDRHIAKKKALQDRIEIIQTPNRGRVEPQLKYSMSLIDNIDRFFQYAPADAKIRALSSIFSGKLEFDGKSFRTDSMNTVLALIYQQTNELRNHKNENEESFSTFPASVPGAGVEPAQG